MINPAGGSSSRAQRGRSVSDEAEVDDPADADDHQAYRDGPQRPDQVVQFPFTHADDANPIPHQVSTGLIVCHSVAMMNAQGYDPDTEQYSIQGAMTALGCSKATLDRWIPPGTEGRWKTPARPGRPSEVRISAALVRQHLPAPGGE